VKDAMQVDPHPTAATTPFETVASPRDAVERLIELHEAAIAAQRTALEQYFLGRHRPDAGRAEPLPLP
jgi:hypothetical protein